MSSPPSHALFLSLREATRGLHHRLDHHPLLAPLVRADLDLAAYGDALAALHGVQGAGERAILEGLRAFDLAYDYHPRQPALEADLVSLGRAPWRTRITAAKCHDPGDLIGLLYVFEGSRLGARVIGRQIACSLSAAPRHFFEERDSSWDDFRRFAETHCPPPWFARADAAARGQFEAFLNHLDDCLAHRIAHTGFSGDTGMLNEVENSPTMRIQDGSP